MGRTSMKLKGRFAVWSRQYRQEMGKLRKSFYVLTQATKTDWTAYLNRAMLETEARDESQRLHDLLKYGSWAHHWNEFVFQGYHHHQHDAIVLAGIPDVKGSLPHASKGKR
jgi:hypothetical protein